MVSIILCTAVQPVTDQALLALPRWPLSGGTGPGA
jgi:hypothetical protein